MPPATTYSSPFPAVKLQLSSIFTFLLSETGPYTIGGYPNDAPAFIDATSGTAISRVQLRKLALAFGYGVLNHPTLHPHPAPLRRGDVVMIFSPNSLAWPVVLMGAFAAGLRATLANSAYTSRELAHQWENSGARVIFCAQELLPVVQEMFKQVGISAEESRRRIVLIGQDLGWAKRSGSRTGKQSSTGLIQWEELLSLGSLPREEIFEGDSVNETVMMCYSSGTTGKPKGVETTHKNLTSVIQITSGVFPDIVGGKDIFLGILPFFHIFGAVILLLFPFYHGSTVVVMPRFDPEAYCRNVQRYKCTMSLVVPPVLVVLARHPAVEKYDMSTLRVCLSGAAPLGAALVKQVRDRLLSLRKDKNAQFDIIQGYGLTETSPTTHILPVASANSKVGSIGILVRNVKARLVVDDDGEIDALPGERGELWLHGPNIMKGYLGNKAATEDCITPDGWFKSGDIGIVDPDGFFWIVDRKKELIKYKGFQVPPAELESVLLTHPDIADAGVIGIDDPVEATELPRAYVVHAHPQCLKTDGDKIAFTKSVATWIASRVAKHKLLRGGVVLINAVPKSPTGKILRRELRDLAKQELAPKAKL